MTTTASGQEQVATGDGEPVRELAGIGQVRGIMRLGRGLLSWLMVPAFLIGKWYTGRAGQLDDHAREADGMTVVLSGVLGRTLLEQQIALGIADAGFKGRIEIVDWTTGNPLWFLRHLRGRDLAAEAALQLVERLAAYRRQRRDEPIHLVGYSGGAYVVLLVLEALPPDVRVTSAAILGPSVSPYLDVTPLAARTDEGLTHFRSPLDLAVLGMLTTVVGTTDGWHCPSAGLVGFHPEGLVLPGEEPIGAARPNVAGRFHECRFGLGWLASFHYGGHFGYANRVWACESLGRELLANRRESSSP